MVDVKPAAIKLLMGREGCFESKNMHITGPTQFKSVFFKDQLYPVKDFRD